MIMTRLVIVASALLAARAYAAQPSAPKPIAAPLRELDWGQLNFLHTTDIHGWWGGHLQEPSFSADWGDYISFAKHLRDRADADGSDLILVDTGDRVEGNGLYDGSDPKGEYTFNVMKQLQFDLICSGNHELYQASSAYNEYYKTVPDYKDQYIASNLDIRDPKTGEVKPLAQRFKKFTTKNQGFRILAFGFIFDFTGNANNTIIHSVEDTVKEDWFQKAIRDKDLDLILIYGHVAIRSKEYDALYKAIRGVQWDIPLQFFGGHSHIRDYKIYDKASVALESGRYMETIGFLSIKGLPAPRSKEQAADSKGLTFSRRYIDNNLFSLHHHSGKDENSFPTELGVNVTKSIQAARMALDLDKIYGCAPHDIWVSRVPYPHEQSMFSWLEERVFPDQFKESKRASDGKMALVITNTGALRFDIFKGPFTRDTTFLVSPFTSVFRYIKDVPYKSAKQVLKLLNNEGPIYTTADSSGIPDGWMLAPPEQISRRSDSAQTDASWMPSKLGDQIQLKDDDGLIPGYTTKDDAGQDGDDTIHSHVQFYDAPNCIQAPVGFKMSAEGEEPDVVDLVYNEFVEKWIILALKYLGQNYTLDDTGVYLGDETMTTVITKWVAKNWAANGTACS